MKYFSKIVSLVLISSLVLSACNNTAEESTPDSGPGNTNVQNVNGNMPDTTTGINLDNSQDVDTTIGDTIR